MSLARPGLLRIAGARSRGANLSDEVDDRPKDVEEAEEPRLGKNSKESGEAPRADLMASDLPQMGLDEVSYPSTDAVYKVKHLASGP